RLPRRLIYRVERPNASRRATGYGCGKNNPREAFEMNILAGCRLGPIWRHLACAAAAAIALGVAAPAAGQTSVDLQLALMVDASGSVNQYRFQLQKRGYVDALRNPKILSAILG